MLRSQEGNHKSGVALAMRHRLRDFYHLQAQRPKTGRIGTHACGPMDCDTFTATTWCNW